MSSELNQDPLPEVLDKFTSNLEFLNKYSDLLGSPHQDFLAPKNLDQNPPPPQILFHEKHYEKLFPDRIGETAYSKSWIIKTLMRIIKVCEKDATPKAIVENTDISNIDSEPEIVELDRKIERDACALWDMSATEEVGQFLIETRLSEIFLDIVEKTKSPRLLEIMTGILANVSAFDEPCRKILKNKTLTNNVLMLSGTTDSPTLIQVLRFVSNCLKHGASIHFWDDAYEKDALFFTNISNILLNSLNSSVIFAVYDLLSTTFEENVMFVETLHDDLFLEGFVASGQTLWKAKENLDKFFSLFNSFCQYYLNVKKFATKWIDLKPLFYDFVNNLDKEGSAQNISRVLAVHSYFEAYNSLLTSRLLERNSVLVDIGYLANVSRFSLALNQYLVNARQHSRKIVDPENGNDVEILEHIEEQEGMLPIVTKLSGYEYYVINLLAESIADTAKTLQSFTDKDEEKNILEEMLRFSAHTKSTDLLPPQYQNY